ncbi:MAG: class I SAM-dependent methyltransferase [Desulfovibrio sp.]|uniref:methyltransferase domain-containing protein n=1 Tax=Desulfovibrio sp. TaxID=885 RepID=UPI0039E52B4C
MNSDKIHPSWENITSLYERHADYFDRTRGKKLFEQAWMGKFFAIAGCKANILDLGCGSGEPLAAYCIANGYRVTGVDGSSPMLDLCKARFPGQEWLLGDMRHCKVSKVFNGILAWDSFFHLPPDDQRGMFVVFKRHAAPGAALMFTSGPCYGEAIGEFQGEELYHASLDATEYGTLLASHGFALVEHVVEDQSCGGHTIWLAQHLG